MKHLIKILTSCTYKNISTLSFSIVIVYCLKILLKNILVNFELSLNRAYELRTF